MHDPENNFQKKNREAFLMDSFSHTKSSLGKKTERKLHMKWDTVRWKIRKTGNVTWGKNNVLTKKRVEMSTCSTKVVTKPTEVVEWNEQESWWSEVSQMTTEMRLMSCVCCLKNHCKNQITCFVGEFGAWYAGWYKCRHSLLKTPIDWELMSLCIDVFL